jgi:hypothetical protein
MNNSEHPPKNEHFLKGTDGSLLPDEFYVCSHSHKAHWQRTQSSISTVKPDILVVHDAAWASSRQRNVNDGMNAMQRLLKTAEDHGVKQVFV